jgi:hypothetical protein
MTDSWHWANRGVDIQDGQLLWYDDLPAVSYASGATSTQVFEDFLAHGAPVEGVPEEILADLHATIGIAIPPLAMRPRRNRPDHIWAAVWVGVASLLWVLFLRAPVAGLAYWVTTLLTACLLGVAGVSMRASTLRVSAARTLIAVLGFLAPIAVLVFLRLWIKSCTGFNYLQLPWDDGIANAVRIAAVVVWLSSTALIVVGTRRSELRSASIFMIAWSGVACIPVMFLLFLSVYGDPAANCVPV